MVAATTIPVRTLLCILQETRADEPCIHLISKACVQWSEVSPNLGEIEQYYATVKASPDVSTTHLQLVSLLLSHVYFNLELESHALEYAIHAGPVFIKYFEQNLPTDPTVNRSVATYVDQIISLCIDEFILYRSAAYAANNRLELSQVLAKVVSDSEGSEKNAESAKLGDLEFVGARLALLRPFFAHFMYSTDSISAQRAQLKVGLQAHDIDLVLKAIGNDPASELLDVILTHRFTYHQFREEVLSTVLAQKWYLTVDMIQGYIACCIALCDAGKVASVLKTLVCSTDGSDRALGYQLALTVFDSSSQSLLRSITETLETPVEAIAIEGMKGTVSDELFADVDINRIIPHEGPASPSPTAVDAVKVESKAEGEQEEKQETKEEANDKDVAEKEDVSKDDVAPTPAAYLGAMLRGEFQSQALLIFSNRRNMTDLGLLDWLKTKASSRHSILQCALIVAHAYMQRGTTSDVWLRNSVDWFAKPSGWHKFMSVASLGCIHQSHVQKAGRVLSTYLPGKPGWIPGNVYSDGGALMAYGLAHANLGNKETLTYLLNQLNESTETAQPVDNGGDSETRNVHETKQCGASVAIGLSGLGSNNPEAIAALDALLQADGAVSGEAAGTSLGLLTFGSLDQTVLESLINAAIDTRHEKIKRGCALGAALCMAGQSSDADVWYEVLIGSRTIPGIPEHNEAFLRYGGVLGLGLAHWGTGSPLAIQRLLASVDDCSDDVKQAAVIALGFVLVGHTNNAVRTLSLMIDSCNFRVRFAACLALGIVGAGRVEGQVGGDMIAVINSLVNATTDVHDLVRQAAFIGISMVYAGVNDRQIIGTTVLPKSEEIVPPASTTDKHGKGKMVLGKLPTATRVRQFLLSVSTDYREDATSRIGSLVGIGIIDCGGRNAFIDTTTRSSVAGLALFTQFWYWFPWLLTLANAMTPSPMMCVVEHNGKLVAPEGYYQTCMAPGSMLTPTQPFVIEKKSAVKREKTILAAAVRSGAAEALKKEQEERKKEEQEKEAALAKQEKETQEAAAAMKEHKIQNMNLMPYALRSACKSGTDRYTRVNDSIAASFRGSNGHKINLCAIDILIDNKPSDEDTYTHF